MNFGKSRVCLAGEDLDWCGGKTIQLPINLRTSCEIKNSLDIEKGTLEIKSYTKGSYHVKKINRQQILGWSYNGDFLDYVIATIKAFYNYTHLFPTGLMTIDSEVPVSSGLCSSASLIMSVVQELNDYFECYLSLKEVIEIAYTAEAKLVKSTVGKMDYYASKFDNIFLYDGKLDNVTKIHYPNLKKIDIFLIYTGNPSSSKIVNLEKMKRYRSGDNDFFLYQQKGNDLVNLMLTEMERNCSIHDLGNLVNEFQGLMKKYLKVSNDSIDYLFDFLNDAGALGTKITGCGLGGYMFSIVSKEFSSIFEKRIVKEGIKYKRC